MLPQPFEQRLVREVQNSLVHVLPLVCFEMDDSRQRFVDRLVPVGVSVYDADFIQKYLRVVFDYFSVRLHGQHQVREDVSGHALAQPRLKDVLQLFVLLLRLLEFVGFLVRDGLQELELVFDVKFDSLNLRLRLLGAAPLARNGLACLVILREPRQSVAVRVRLLGHQHFVIEALPPEAIVFRGLAWSRPHALKTTHYLTDLQRADGFAKVWLFPIDVDHSRKGKPLLGVEIHALLQISHSCVEAAAEVERVESESLKVEVQRLVARFLLLFVCFEHLVRPFSFTWVHLRGLYDLEGTLSGLRLEAFVEPVFGAFEHVLRLLR